MLTAVYFCAKRFIVFVTDELPAREFEGMPHLADYAYVWLGWGRGATICGGDFSIYLSALLLAAEWMRSRPGSFDYKQVDSRKPRTRPTAVMDDVDCVLCAQALSPQFFQLLSHDPDWVLESIAAGEYPSIDEHERLEA